MIALQPVLTLEERLDNMQKALDEGFPFLKKAAEFHDGRMSIVGYGPSLRDTWRSIQHPMIATSGAYDFLLERGVVPDFYTAIDPRKCTAALLRNPQHETKYLMASVVHPDFWSILEGFDVTLWHAVYGMIENMTQDDMKMLLWIGDHHNVGLESCIGGGSTVGQRAIVLAGAMGFRKFDIFGMDCSFMGHRHAGAHTGEEQHVETITVANRKFRTTRQLFQSAQEMEKLLLTMDIETEFYGDGMLQEIARIIKRKRNK